MTYCVAMLLDTGLVFLSDSRTSAGVDQISTFRKTTVYQHSRASACWCCKAPATSPSRRR
jgi:predicted proteasome-type protease